MKAIRRCWMLTPVLLGALAAPIQAQEAATKPRGLERAEFHVAPDGSDSNPGILEKPFNSLVVARDAIRELKKAAGLPRDGVRVLVRGGLYLLDETLMFEPEDSGTKESPIVYEACKGETPVISGAHQIKGWTRLTDEPPGVAPAARGRLWAADVPKGWLFHYLYVNGEVAQRAREPNHDNWQEWPKIVGLGEPEKAAQSVTFPKATLDHLRGSGDVEMCFIHAGRAINSISVLKSVDPARSTARRHSRNVTPHGGAGDPFRIENALAAIQGPGQWCIDSAAGRVYYWPPGGGMDATTVLAPALYNLVLFQGGEEEEARVRHVHLRGLTFAHSDRMGENLWPREWLKPNGDNPDAAVFLQGAEDCGIESCRILYAGAYAVALDRHAQRIRVVGNEMGYLGCGGVRMHGYGPGTRSVNRDNVISRNHIHHAGLAPYWSSAAITLYGSGHNQITYNYIHDVPHCGVAIVGTCLRDVNSRSSARGFSDAYGSFEAMYCIQWDTLPEGSQDRYKENKGAFTRQGIKQYLNSGDNTVACNVIVRAMQRLCGGGALYSRSCGNGNVWKENVIRNARHAPSSFPIYMDEEVDAAAVEDNVVWGPGQPMNKGENKWIGNTVSPDRTPAYDALLGRILREVKEQGGWLGQTGPLDAGPSPASAPVPAGSDRPGS